MDEYILESPVGYLQLKASEEALIELSFADSGEEPNSSTASSPIIQKAILQLNEYFKGERTAFDLPISPRGTEFQLQVWNMLKEIPFGATSTYAELSQKLGNPKAIRAIGNANGQNPIPIIIPCHRVIGSDGNLVGYSGGIERKRQLLQLEGTLLL